MHNLPNILTLFRIIAIPFIIFLYYLQSNYIANNNDIYWINLSIVLSLGIVSLTDYLDGYLARKYNVTSKMGEFLDPVADKLMIVASLILIVDFYHLWHISICAIIIIMREIMVSAMREWLASVNKREKIKVSLLGKAKTTIQIFAILFLFYQDHVFYIDSFYIGLTLLFLATLLTLQSGIQYLLIFFQEY